MLDELVLNEKRSKILKTVYEAHMHGRAVVTIDLSHIGSSVLDYYFLIDYDFLKSVAQNNTTLAVRISGKGINYLTAV